MFLTQYKELQYHAIDFSKEFNLWLLQITYAGALLEVCMRKLVFYPEIVGFIEEEKEKFPSVKVQYSFNSPPKMIMLDDNGEHAETIRWVMLHCFAFLASIIQHHP